MADPEELSQEVAKKGADSSLATFDNFKRREARPKFIVCED